jgi:hypothetical protein
VPIKPSAIHTKHGGRLPVDSQIDVIQREKARYTVALGWSYRFKSGQTWRLIPLDEVASWEFESKPEGS